MCLIDIFTLKILLSNPPTFRNHSIHSIIHPQIFHFVRHIQILVHFLTRNMLLHRDIPFHNTNNLWVAFHTLKNLHLFQHLVIP